MSELKHTKGEWGFSKHGTPDYAPQFGIYASGETKDLAIVVNDNAEANAKLITAAPELLAALRYVADLTDTALTKEQAKILSYRARAAIDKVTV